MDEKPVLADPPLDLPLDRAGDGRTIIPSQLQMVGEVVLELRKEERTLESLHAFSLERDECIIRIFALELLIKTGKISAKSLTAALMGNPINPRQHSAFIEATVRSLQKAYCPRS